MYGGEFIPLDPPIKMLYFVEMRLITCAIQTKPIKIYEKKINMQKKKPELERDRESKKKKRRTLYSIFYIQQTQLSIHNGFSML